MSLAHDLCFCLIGHENNEGKFLCTVNKQNANTNGSFHVKAVTLVTRDSDTLVISCKLSCCHATGEEDSGCLGCDAVLLGLLNPDENTKFHHNFGNIHPKHSITSHKTSVL
jgi:hypothetical protein